MLGGNAEFLTVAELASAGLSPVETPDDYEAAWEEAFARVKAQVQTEADKVVEAGGLYVLGTERHESRRIDNQLRGRSGRQGDPGESRFYLSLTDDLMRLFNSGAAEAIMSRSNIPDDTAIESTIVSRAIRSAQSQVEARNAEIRKNVLKYDDVLNRQREAIYSDRAHILEGDDLSDRAHAFLEDVVDEALTVHVGEGNGDDWDFDALWNELKTIYPIGLTIDEVIQEAGNKGRVNREFMRREIQSDAVVAYKAREDTLGTPAMRELERRVVLSVIDRRWRDHLYEMDYLKDGIGLRAMAQRDPLVEYQREGFALYQGMMAQIKAESVGFLFNLEVEVNQAPGDPAHPSIAAKGLARDDAAGENLSYIAPSEDGQVEVKDERGRVEQAATAKAQNLADNGRQVTPEQAQGSPAAAAPATGQGARGAFGQKSPGAPGAVNRADRRKK
jgi:preprotein translocase subunit SecA